MRLWIKRPVNILMVVAVLSIAVGMLINFIIKDKISYNTEAIYAMDTIAQVSVFGDEPDEYISLIKELDKALNAYDESDELYRLNRSGYSQNADISDIFIKSLSVSTPSVNVTSGRLIELWSQAEQLQRLPTDDEIKAALETIGTENVRVSDGSIELSGGAYLNFGSCAKGYACDRVKELLSRNGVSSAVVTFGSSAVLHGTKPDGAKFQTSVRDPFVASGELMTVETKECFISTSGSYQRFWIIEGERYSHILDLKSGYPAPVELVSVTVICDSGIKSDILSTEIYISGIDNLRQHLAAEDYQIIAVDSNRNVYISESLKEHVTLKAQGFTIK